MLQMICPLNLQFNAFQDFRVDCNLMEFNRVCDKIEVQKETDQSINAQHNISNILGCKIEVYRPIQRQVFLPTGNALKYKLTQQCEQLQLYQFIVLEKMSDFINKSCLRNLKRKYSQNRAMNDCCYIYQCEKCTKVQITKVHSKESYEMEEETKDIQLCQDRQNMYFCVVESEDFKAYTEDETETELLQI